MYWSLFFYPGEGLPPVDLSGLGGEKQEFQAVMLPTSSASAHPPLTQP